MKRFALVLATLLLAGSRPLAADADASRQADVERKGKAVMPFDQSASMHVFVPTARGGVQTVMVHDGDPAQVALVRSHLRAEAARFARGDFRDPAAIHGTRMPGLRTLSAGAGRIAVTYADVATGGRITYATGDPRLVRALHAWFAAQVRDHGRRVMSSLE
ncbi:hypothetical protein WPS_26530 [Vulcanimicrobium alpinum]|uniref:Aspartate carbamoyltransferase n=1 Tax=Vulcanimicrobium alpinum TaxID=3016050 RepID=A0AAN2CB62_UNVUL|nr:hypothetical protein [Vulcanimicrobium alpinum]BDE07377.1 hypothetical protein WPS_26530 [Vulcanimicrobium alpinum]